MPGWSTRNWMKTLKASMELLEAVCSPFITVWLETEWQRWMDRLMYAQILFVFEKTFPSEAPD